MNIWDMLILASVLAVVLLALRSIRKINGKSCSCGCADCPSGSRCRRSAKEVFAKKP